MIIFPRPSFISGKEHNAEECFGICTVVFILFVMVDGTWCVVVGCFCGEKNDTLVRRTADNHKVREIREETEI